MASVKTPTDVVNVTSQNCRVCKCCVSVKNGTGEKWLRIFLKSAPRTIVAKMCEKIGLKFVESSDLSQRQ